MQRTQLEQDICFFFDIYSFADDLLNLSTNKPFSVTVLNKLAYFLGILT